MIIRSIKEDDYSELFKWFDCISWPTAKVQGSAPDWGVVAEHDGNLYACCFVYLTGRSVAFIEWTAINPELPPETTVKALESILSYLKKSCDHSDIKSLVFTTSSEKLSNRFRQNEFKVESKVYKCTWTLK